MTNLAQLVLGAEAAFLRAEKRLEQLLDSIYERYDDFEIDAMHGIDVYGVTASPAAVDALLRAGFARVTEHDHARVEFIHCACRREET